MLGADHGVSATSSVEAITGLEVSSQNSPTVPETPIGARWKGVVEGCHEVIGRIAHQDIDVGFLGRAPKHLLDSGKGGIVFLVDGQDTVAFFELRQWDLGALSVGFHAGSRCETAEASTTAALGHFGIGAI